MPTKRNPTLVTRSRTRDSAVIHAELDRLDRHQRRLEQAIARQKAEHGHRQAARRHLPCGFPDAETAAGMQPALWPVGFRRELEPAIVGQVREALLRSRFAAALDGVADALGCDRLAVLMTEAGRAVRRGVKSRILLVRYQYNPTVNEVLRATGGPISGAAPPNAGTSCRMGRLSACCRPPFPNTSAHWST